MIFESVSFGVRRAACSTFLFALLLSLLPVCARATSSVTLAWDQSPDPSVVGYNIYFGVASRTYTNMVSAGNATSVTINGLIEGVTYFFAATTYNAVGIESDYSTEISYTIPVPIPNQPPTISGLTNLTIAVSTQTPALPFTIGDAETPAANLTLSAYSSNPTLVLVTNIVFGGSGASRTVTVIPTAGRTGSATISIVVSDGKATATNSFSLTVVSKPPPPANFHLSVQGNGKLSPDLSTKALVVGATYTVTAVAGADQEFAGWSGNVSSSQTTISFKMTTNFTLLAKFVPSPFSPKAGTYNGLFYEADAVRQSTSGAFTLSTTKRGYYSGRLQVGTARYSFHGRFNLDTQATNTIPRHRLSPLIVELTLGSGEQADQIFGRVYDTNGTWSASLSGDRALFNTRTNPAPWAGPFTMVLPGEDGDPSLPAGNGFATIRVGLNGVARLAVVLPDGGRFSESAPLSQTGLWPVYIPLYSGRGSLLSWLSFTNRPTDDLNGNISWIKPANLHTRYYSAGFTNILVAQGSAYVRPASPTNSVLTYTNAILTFTGGNLGADFTNLISLGRSSRVFNQSTNVLSMSFSLPQGTFSGHVKDPASGKSRTFRGAILQKQNAGFGLLLGTNRTSSVSLTQF
jgi:hypothetical protein